MKGGRREKKWRGNPGERESKKGGGCLRYLGDGGRGQGNEVIHHNHNGSNALPEV